MSRYQDRRDMDTDQRVRYLEDDLDRVEERIGHNRANSDMAFQGISRRIDDIDDEFKAYRKETSDEVAGNRKVMVGVLISTLSVAIAIVAQVLIMRGGN